MNFTYLENYHDLAPLYTHCKECENFAVTAPDISITAARKALEFTVKLLYGTHINSNIRSISLFDMLSDWDFKDLLGSRNLMDTIHAIRRVGNQAVHEGNMSSGDALMTLEKLHFAIGELCVRLGVISTYPTFDPNLTPTHPTATPAAGEPEVDENLIRRIIQLTRNRMKSADHADTEKKIIDVHYGTTRGVRPAKKLDFGANSKAAHQHLAALVHNWFPDANILMETTGSQFIVINAGKETVFAVKTGCSILGAKNWEGQWQILPNVDYVLYAPDVTADMAIEQQFRLFSKDEFLKFWEDLGLLRYKVSTSMRKRIISQMGEDVKITTEEHADNLTIQSFTNSGRKYPLVKQGLSARPIISESILHSIIF